MRRLSFGIEYHGVYILMGAVKIVKNKKVKKNQKPIIQEELFPFNAPHEIEAKVKEYAPRHGGSLLIVLATLLLLGGAGYFFFENSFQKEEKKPYVFFEIKAIDVDGHPIAGASVKNNQVDLGMTDSFGEWRRFLEVSLGSKMDFLMEKENLGIEGRKSFLIPKTISDKGDLELTATIQLKPRVQKIGVGLPEKSVGLAKQGSVLKSAHGSRGDERNKSRQNGMNIDEFSNISIEFNNAQSGLYSEQDAKSARSLENLVVPELKLMAQKVGLTVDPDAKWKIVLTHLPRSASMTSHGVVNISIHIPGSDENLEFLKNYIGSPVDTARKILWGLRAYTAKSYQIVQDQGRWLVLFPKNQSSFWDIKPGAYLRGKNGNEYQVSAVTMPHGDYKASSLVVMNGSPCEGNASRCLLFTKHMGVSSPGENWDRLKVQIYGMPKSARLFVAGYQGTYEGGKVWSFWGQYGVNANVTIVDNNVVIFRQKIVGNRGKTPLINIPSANYSKTVKPEWVR